MWLSSNSFFSLHCTSTPDLKISPLSSKSRFNPWLYKLSNSRVWMTAQGLHVKVIFLSLQRCMFFLPLSVNQHHYHFSHSQSLTLSLLNHTVYTVKDWGLHALHEKFLWEKSSRDKFWGFSNPDNTCPMGGKVWSFKHKYISHFLQHSGINLREHLVLLFCYGLFLWVNTIHSVMWITENAWTLFFSRISTRKHLGNLPHFHFLLFSVESL